MKDYLSNLKKVEKRIKDNYLLLINEEARGLINSSDYNALISELSKNIEEETDILFAIYKEEDITSIKNNLLKRINLKNAYLMDLIRDSKAFYFRLINFLNPYETDDLFVYESALRYDINKIINKFLETLITKEEFENIKEELITYKYNQIYLNNQSEYDFINDNYDLKMEALAYRTEDAKSYVYVDEKILVLEIYFYLELIEQNKDYFWENKTKEATIVISIINILTRITLYDRYTIDIAYEDLKTYLDNNISINEVFEQMLKVLDGFKKSLKKTC